MVLKKRMGAQDGTGHLTRPAFVLLNIEFQVTFTPLDVRECMRAHVVRHLRSTAYVVEASLNNPQRMVS